MAMLVFFRPPWRDRRRVFHLETAIEERASV
jgi:hypothetical protein